jgi:DNA-binding NtrC family response regulator
MRFLVVDGHPSHGRALGATLVRLGHSAWVVSYPKEVPESLSVQDIDAVIASIESPSICGMALAQQIADRAPGLPIAFSAGSLENPTRLFQASHIGPILPGRWTPRDVERLIDEIVARTQRQFAEGTAEPRPRRVNLSCSTWDKVARLARSRARVRIRGNYVLQDGDEVQVSLSLPDEIVLAVDGRVINAQRNSSYIELTGLHGALSSHLLDLALERNRG